MSQENMEILRRAFEVFSRDGPAGVISGGFWSPEIVWDASRSGIPGHGVYRGHDEVRSYFEDDWFQAFPFEEWEVEIEQLIDNGDQVIAMSRQRGRGATAGVASELELALVFDLRDGQIVRVETYLDRMKALEAAGLSDPASN
jgi:ketosteroid isomerase-like protein